MADTIQDLLNNHNPAPRWTEKELVDWLQSQPEWRRERLLDILKKAQDRGIDPVGVLYQIREEVDEKENCSIFEGVVAALKGYATGVALIHGPAAIKNLAKGSD